MEDLKRSSFFMCVSTSILGYKNYKTEENIVDNQWVQLLE